MGPVLHDGTAEYSAVYERRRRTNEKAILLENKGIGQRKAIALFQPRSDLLRLSGKARKVSAVQCSGRSGRAAELTGVDRRAAR